MRRLLLLRHAKAEPAGDFPDFNRALTARGRTDARAIGGHIAARGLSPDFAVVSPARRAAETWQVVEEALASADSASCAHAFDPRLYGASEETLLTVIRALPGSYRLVMLVGHNPGLEELAKSLIAGGAKRALEDLREKFPTSAFAVIEFDAGGWKRVAPRTGTLKLFVTPASLARAEK